MLMSGFIGDKNAEILGSLNLETLSSLRDSIENALKHGDFDSKFTHDLIKLNESLNKVIKYF